MTKAVVVLCSCESQMEAKRLAHAIVERRLAARVNLVPVVTSVIRWEDEVQSAAEHLLLIKTIEERVPALTKALQELHTYDLLKSLCFQLSAAAISFWPG